VPNADVTTAVGKESHDAAMLSPNPAERLLAALDLADRPLRPGDPLPQAWHWLYFFSSPRGSTLGPDGRGGKGELLPEFEGLNRMWAGGALTVHRQLRIGETIKRHSRIVALEEKKGRTGRLILANLEHRLSDSAGLAQVERHDLVFRERKPQTGIAPGERPATEPRWRRALVPNEVLLFRFSALTYNAHRIHYDWPYATQTEGYPALLVHGPLTAILLLDAIEQNSAGRQLVAFDYRALRPLFCGNPLTICAAPTAGEAGIEVWAEDHEGFVAMRGKGMFA